MELRSTAGLSTEAASPRWADTFPPIARASMTPEPWIGVARGLQRALLPGHRDSEGDAAPRTEPSWFGAARRRRAALGGLVLCSSAIATFVLIDGGRQAPASWPHALLVLLFALLFAWVSAGFVTAMMGFVVALRGDRHGLSAPRDGAASPIDPAARTAIIMPICNEDVATVFAGLGATCRSLAATGALRLFDIYILSDSADPALRDAELRAWQKLRQDLGDGDGAQRRVFYRWRRRRTKRKSGNVADFCRRWGANYRYMVVLDADSVMSGDSLVALVRAMEAHPEAGIVQTAPRAVGHATLHARAQQFASRVSGKLFADGLSYWQLGESHYWGHNAILRVAPFMKHCALAPIRGRGGLAGEILSHDFVEAALMRRAGYEVWLAPDIAGSYEQQPPNVIEELQRDRRWCQGNLQNAQLIAEPGLTPVHRAMFATGAMSYLASPLWLGFVLLGLAHALGGAPTAALPDEAFALSMVTLSLLLLPRAMGVALLMLRGEQRRYGGSLKLAASALIEALLSVLQAPLRMVAHTVFVIGALTGLKLEWKSPARDSAALGWRDAWRVVGGVGVLAAAILAALATADEATLMWRVAPLLVPLAIAAPLAVWTSRAGIGRWLRRRGLLLTPEEVETPALLRSVVAEEAEPATAVVATPPAKPAAVRPIPARPVAAAPRRAVRAPRPGLFVPALRTAAVLAGLGVPIVAPMAPPMLMTHLAPPVHEWSAATPIVAETLLPVEPPSAFVALPPDPASAMRQASAKSERRAGGRVMRRAAPS